MESLCGGGTLENTLGKQLEHVQRAVLIGIFAALRTTPTMALNAILLCTLTELTGLLRHKLIVDLGKLGIRGT